MNLKSSSMLLLLYTYAFSFLLFISATAITIHLSPDGEDRPNCGASLSQKCQTIDYVLSQTEHNNITFVFETSTVDSLKYNITQALQRINEKVSLRFMKDDDKGRNPTIYGGNVAFIGDRKREVRIEIESIDLHNVFLLNVSNTVSLITINITASSIYIDQSNFISVKQAKRLFTKLHRCTLTSPAIIEADELVVDKYFWLDIEMKSDANESEISITDTKISGGRFHIKNVQSFEVSKCRIENNIPVVPDGSITIFYITKNIYYRETGTFNLAKLFPNLTEENRNTTSIPNSIFISAKQIFNLKNVKKFNFVDCNIQRIIAVKFFHAKNVNGVIQDTTLMDNLIIQRLMEGENIKMNFSHINIGNFPPSNELRIIDVSDRAVRLTNFSIVSMQRIHYVLRLAETQCEVNGLNINNTIGYGMFILYQPRRQPWRQSFISKFSNVTIRKVECGNHILEVYGFHQLSVSNFKITESKIGGYGFEFIKCFLAHFDHLTITDSTFTSPYYSFIRSMASEVNLLNFQVSNNAFTKHVIFG